MPLTERDPNFSGRMSRASNMSTGSRGLQKGNPDLFSNAPGVRSMLRTSTELGDIGTLTFDSSHLPSMPRAPQPHRRSGAASRLSGFPPNEHPTIMHIWILECSSLSDQGYKCSSVLARRIVAHRDESTRIVTTDSSRTTLQRWTLLPNDPH